MLSGKAVDSVETTNIQNNETIATNSVIIEIPKDTPQSVAVTIVKPDEKQIPQTNETTQPTVPSQATSKESKSTESWSSFLKRKPQELATSLYHGLFTYHPVLSRNEKIAETASGFLASLGALGAMDNGSEWFFNQCGWEADSAAQFALFLGFMAALSSYLYSKKLFNHAALFFKNYKNMNEGQWLMLMNLHSRVKKLENQSEGSAASGSSFRDEVKQMIDDVTTTRKLSPAEKNAFQNKMTKIQDRIDTLSAPKDQVSLRL